MVYWYFIADFPSLEFGLYQRTAERQRLRNSKKKAISRDIFVITHGGLRRWLTGVRHGLAVGTA